MLVHKKGDSELVFDLPAFEKKDQSGIEQIKQILEAAEIIKTVARQSRIPDFGQRETGDNKQKIPAILNKKAIEIIGMINDDIRSAQDFETLTPNVIASEEDESLKILKVRFAKGEISKEEYDEIKSVLKQTIRTPKKHQRLVNVLALELEAQHGIKITGIDFEGDPLCFDQKFRSLPMPDDHGGMPNVQGMDSNGIIHLGKAEIDVNDSNVEEQLKSFSSRYMKGTKIPVRLHVIVPKEIRKDMESKIYQIGLGDKLDFGIITVQSL